MNNEKIMAIVEDIREKMELPEIYQTDPNRKPGAGFVVTAPLKQESTIAFISKGNFSTDNQRKGIPVQKPSFGPTTRAVSAPVEVKSNSQEKPARAQSSKLPDVTNLPKAISKVSNLIKDYLHGKGDPQAINIFDKIKSGIRDKKMFADTFYTRTQNCIYHTLRDFVGITKDENNNDVLPVVTSDMECLSTLIFFDRIFNNRTVSFEKTPDKVMPKYRKTFSDCDGIQLIWIDLFTAKMKEKLPAVDEHSLKQIVETIKNVWCSTTETSLLNPPEPQAEQTRIAFVSSLDDSSICPFTKENTISENEEENINDENPNSDIYDEDKCLRINIEFDGGFDIVTIISSVLINSEKSRGREDQWQDIAIPFFTNLDKIKLEDEMPSMADDRNGIWDWLIHFQPDMIFTTRDPDKYLKGNTDEDITYIKCVIMDENEGTYVIGVYYIDSELGCVEDGDTFIRKINNLVKNHVALGDISHLTRSLSITSLFKDENYVLRHVSEYENDKEGENYGDEEYDPDDEILLTAEESMIGDSNSEDIHYSEGTDSQDDGAEYGTDEQEMDSSIVSIGHQFEEDESSRSFTPMRKGKKGNRGGFQEED